MTVKSSFQGWRLAVALGTNRTNADWKDKLASYNGTAITYDALGNPLTYGSNTYTWNGRRMATYSNGTTETEYRYDENGIRTSKIVGNTKTSFFIDGTTILAQKTGNTTIPFYYDGNGKRIAFKYGGSMYFYVYNLQGDVTHILDADANIVGTYTYDAWGKITNLSSLTSIAQTNPFRYRGYYYDTESGLYYLNSRYYNPDWGRFLNADGYVTTGQGLTSYNMFTYCGNNPINRVDSTGCFWKEIGDFFKSGWNNFKVFLNDTFGSYKSETVTYDIDIIPDPLPITITTGSSSTEIENNNTTSKPIEFYFDKDPFYPILSSSAGVNINISSFTLDIHFGFDDIGISGSHTTGNNSKEIGLRINPMGLKVGIEYTTAVSWENTITASYTNVSASGYLLAYAVCYYIMGQPVHTPVRSR